MAPELRINVNESEMTETWKDTVCSLCRIGGACPFIKEMVLTRTGVIIKITEENTLGDYTSEFQSVLRACEEDLGNFRISFLPYGLLIKFANEGGGNDDDKPNEETKEEAKDLTPHLSSMTFVDVFVSDVGGGNRHKYVVDLKDGDGMDFYLKVAKDFDYPNSAVLYKKDNGLEISSCWMLRVFAGLLNDGDELVINYKYSSGMVRFQIDTCDDTFAYTLWASKQDTIGDIYERALKLPNVVLSKLSPVFTAEADTNQDAKKCSGEFGEEEGASPVVGASALTKLEKPFHKTPPSDGLCLLKDEVGSFEGYKVFYFDGDGDAHVATAYGCYQINLEEFSRNHNVLILHDDECYKENLVKDLMEFLGYKVSCEMVVNVLSREGLDFGILPIIAMTPSDFTDKIQPFLESKDIQKLKKIKSNFVELLNSSAEKTDDNDQSSGDDFIYTMEFDMMVEKAYGFDGECVSKNEKKDKVIIKPMYDTAKSIVLYYNAETTKVSQVFDDLYDITQLPRGAFDLLLKKTNHPINPDNLLSVFEDDNGEFNFVIRLGGLKGGAKGTKVIKTVLKGNVRDVSCVGASDKSIFESIINQSEKLTTLKMEDVKAVFTSLPLETLQEMEAYLTKHKGTANVKSQGVISFIPAIKDMDTLMSKIGATTEKARGIIHDYFKSECIDDAGEIRVPLITKFIQGRIAVKMEGYTAPPVAVPSVAVPHADVHMRG